MNLHTYTVAELVKYNGEEDEEDEIAEVYIDIELKGAKFTPQSYEEPADFYYDREVFCKDAIAELEQLLEEGYEFLDNKVDTILDYALEQVLDKIDDFNDESNWTRY